MRFIILFVFLCGCASPQPQTPRHTIPVQIGTSVSDGYTFEVWERPDGTHYLQRSGHQMDLYEKPRK